MFSEPGKNHMETQVSQKSGCPHSMVGNEMLPPPTPLEMGGYSITYEGQREIKHETEDTENEYLEWVAFSHRVKES